MKTLLKIQEQYTEKGDRVRKLRKNESIRKSKVNKANYKCKIYVFLEVLKQLLQVLVLDFRLKLG